MMHEGLRRAMKSTPIDSKKAGQSNEKLILTLLRKQGPLSQSQLCRLTELGSSTASVIVSRLREKGLVLESEGHSTRRGPKPVILAINPRARFIAGVEITATYCFVGLFDYTMTLIDQIRVVLDQDPAPETVTESLSLNLLGLFQRNQVDMDQVLGVGVALSGTISPAGNVQLSSPLGWKHVPLREMLEGRLDCPVHVCPTRVRLLAEMADHPERRFRNVLYLNVADGVGSTAIVDGNLLDGATSRSGEIGHFIVDPEGAPCGCGHRGCLETLISGPALAAHIRERIQAGQNTLLANEVEAEDSPEAVLGKWGLALRQQDAFAQEICQTVTEHLSRAAALAINLYDPDLVILAGYVCAQCGEPLLQTLQDFIGNNVYDGDSREIVIRPARAGDHALMKGAALTAMQAEGAA